MSCNYVLISIEKLADINARNRGTISHIVLYRGKYRYPLWVYPYTLYIPIYSIVWGVPQVPRFRTFEKSLCRNAFLKRRCGNVVADCSAKFRQLYQQAANIPGIIIRSQGQNHAFRADTANTLAFCVALTFGCYDVE